MSSRYVWLIAMVLSVPLAAQGKASAFHHDEYLYNWRPRTLVEDFHAAKVVLFVHWQGTRKDANGKTVTDFNIDQVIKHDPAMKVTRTITIPRDIAKTKSKTLLYCDLVNGDVVPQREKEIPPGSDLMKYLLEGVQRKGQPKAQRLRQCFDYLFSAQGDVAAEARLEFGLAEYKDIQAMAKTLPANKIIARLRDPKTDENVKDVCCLLLGHCGKPDDAKLLRTMIDEGLKKGGWLTGPALGYLMLQPKEAGRLIASVVRDEKQSNGTRSTCIDTIRILGKERPDLISREMTLACMACFLPTLNNPNEARFGISSLGQLKCWEATDRVLDLWDKEGYTSRSMEWCILGFALQSPHPRAVAFVARQRELDPGHVDRVMEDLNRK